MFRKPSTLFRIIAHSPKNGKVRPLTSLFRLLPNDDTEEVVSTDTRTHQFEIAFSSTVSGEQDLYEQCYNKNEESVCDSDDDMPELTRTPEQTFDATKTKTHQDTLMFTMMTMP